MCPAYYAYSRNSCWPSKMASEYLIVTFISLFFYIINISGFKKDISANSRNQ